MNGKTKPTLRPGATTTHPLDRFLAIVGAVVCLIVTILIWWSVSAQQTMWPLPGIYFIEMVALSVTSALTFVRDDPYRNLIVWGAVGIFSAFSIMGAWSVGFFYLPVVFIFGAIATISDLRNKQPIAAHFGVCIIAGIAQAVLMIAVIRLH